MKPGIAEQIGAQARAHVEAHLKRFDLVVAPAFFDRIEKFAAILALWGSRMNLTARPGDPGEIAFHVIDSLAPLAMATLAGGAMLRGVFEAGREILDIGSGAGFPALVLAAASAAHFTLCESRRKRASFLEVAIAEMGLDNVSLKAVPVTAASFTGIFNVVTARAIGALPDFYRIAAAALRAGGIAILYAAPSQRLKLDDARAAALDSSARVAYEIDREGARLKRVLVLWHKRA